MFSPSRRVFLFFLFIIVLKAVAAVFVIKYASIGLVPDEAQYWTWSQQLDWGYYSKPPGIAWQIFASCWFLGSTELGVRFSAIVLSILLSLTVYYCSRSAGLRVSTSSWAGIIMTLTPMGLMGSFITTTDGGMVLFWSLASAVLLAAMRDQRTPNYWIVGLLIGCGALFKWPTYWLWLVIFSAVAVVPLLRCRTLLGGVFVSFLGIVPSFIWNYSHDWATFRHVAATIFVSKPVEKVSSVAQGNFFDFLGAQLALLSPIIFILLVMSFIYLIRHREEVALPLKFCGWTCLLVVGLHLVFSIFKKMQGNWCVFVYPLGIVFLSWYICERLRRGRRWMIAGLLVSVFIAAFVFSIPTIQKKGWLPIPYKINPFRHSLGWEALRGGLAQAGYDSDENFLIGDKYQTASILSFYNDGQKRAYFFNIHGARKNQFSYWPGLEDEQVGKTGFFVWIENTPHFEKWVDNRSTYYQQKLSPYFQEVTVVGRELLFSAHGTLAKGALIFRCENYNGKTPEETNVSY